jgi:ubiquinone/menaquinone biosynthesis C-methylase UbiE
LRHNHNADVENFNRSAHTFEHAHRQSILFDRVQKTVLELTSNETPQTVMDVGCGTGLLLRKAQERWPNAQMIGIDPAENMIAQATHLFPTAKFIVAMAEKIPLPDLSVDLAFSTLSYHHWVNQDKGVAEIARVLRLGGKFLLSDIVMPWGLSRFGKQFKRNNPNKMRQTFVAAGLKVELQQRRFARFFVVTVGKKP